MVMSKERERERSARSKGERTREDKVSMKNCSTRTWNYRIERYCVSKIFSVTRKRFQERVRMMMIPWSDPTPGRIDRTACTRDDQWTSEQPTPTSR